MPKILHRRCLRRRVIRISIRDSTSSSPVYAAGNLSAKAYGATSALKEAEEHAVARLSSLMLFKCLFKDACVHVLIKRQLLEACLTCEQVKLCAVYECLFRYKCDTCP